jgi:putative DNA primase/helicase
MNFQQLSHHLKPYLTTILADISPGGRQEGREYKASSIYGGQGDSFSFNLDTQKWADFATSDHQGGDIVSLYAAVKSMKQINAAHELAQQYGFKTEKNVTDNPPSGIHPKHGKPEKLYVYKNTDSSYYMAVYRYKLAELNSKNKHKKHFSQWHFDYNIKKWVAKKPPNGYLLYNLDQIQAHPNKKIVICEGEKSAEAVSELLSSSIYIGTCWPGGSKNQNIDNTNLTPLANRDVILWPDNDDEGKQAMQHVAARIAHLAKTITTIKPDPADPDTFDAADLVALQQDHQFISDWLKKRATKLKSSSSEVVSTVSPRAADQPLQDTHPDYSEASAIIRWQEYNLQMKSQYKVFEHEENVVRVLEKHPIIKSAYYFDEFENQYMSNFQNVKPERAGELEVTKLKMLLQREFMFGQISTAAVKSALGFHLKSVPRKNFMAEQLSKLEWDKTARVDTFFMDIYGADDNEYNRAASRIFWLQLVNRITRPGCKVDIMLILEGAQGIRKSTSLRTIATPDYFTEAGADISKKDFFIKLKSKMIVEFGELNTFSKADQNQLKEVITTQVDQYRDLFQPEDTPHPRTCVFVGTTNDKHYLKDETGARRYMPVECKSVDIDKLVALREQYFAEAYSRLDEDYWTFPVDAHKQITDERSVELKDEDPWADKVRKYAENKATFSITNFLTDGVDFGGLGIEIGRTSRKDSLRVSSILKQMEW